jgi:SRSO17 transposase
MEEEVGQWPEDLAALIGRVEPVFANRRGRDRVGHYVRGLLSSAERKNGWQLAEQVGEGTPYAMQQFLYRGGWDPNELSRVMRQYVIETLGDADGVLVVDETGFLKKGRHSVGVQRQYSGTAGRIENCQIGVFLGYVSPHGRAMLDRELYLPAGWTDDRERCQKAGVPDSVAFKTKPELARTMIGRVLEEGVPARWVAGDSVYGDDPALRADLEARPIGYVLATSLNDAQVPVGMRRRPLKEVVTQLADSQWQRLSAGTGSKGERWYDWQLVELSTFPRRGWRRALLVRRNITDPSIIKVHRCFHPDNMPLDKLVQVAGCRWTIETDIEETKGEVGLDHYEVRSWGGWYRHISLALLAHAFLVVTKATDDAADAAAVKGGLNDRPPTPMTAFKISRGLLSP